MAKKKQNESDAASAGKSGAGPASGVDFESALAEVEQVVEQLESGELGLSESLVQYERGIEKIKRCHQVLEQVEKRIAVLTSVDEDGTPSLEPVDLGGESGLQESDADGKPAGKRASKKSRPPVSDVDDSGALF